MYITKKAICQTLLLPISFLFFMITYFLYPFDVHQSFSPWFFGFKIYFWIHFVFTSDVLDRYGTRIVLHSEECFKKYSFCWWASLLSFVQSNKPFCMGERSWFECFQCANPSWLKASSDFNLSITHTNPVSTHRVWF